MERASASADRDSGVPIISADGRYVLYCSAAENLAVNASNAPYHISAPFPLNVYLFDSVQGISTLVSVDLSGTAGGNGGSLPAAISTNDQYVLFESEATNLVAGDTNGMADIFRRDLSASQTTVVTVAADGSGANGPSTDAAMTPDGRYVAFSSLASNLAPGDTNNIADVFVRDLQAGTTVLVSAGSQAAPLPYVFQGTGSAISGSDLPGITPDGRYVVFLSTATNVAPGITNIGEVYVRDLMNQSIGCVSTNADRYFQNAASFSPRISANGQYVAYESISVGSLAHGMIFRHNVQSGANDLVSSNAVVPAGNYEEAQYVDMTPDGRYIVYLAYTNAAYNASCVLLWDGQTGTTSLVSVNTNGVVPSGEATADSPLISASGQYVSYQSSAYGLTTNAPIIYGGQHVYLSDLALGTNYLVDMTTNMTQSRGSPFSGQVMDTSGRYVAFDSTSADLVTNDQNASIDVLWRDMVTGATLLVSRSHPLLTSRTPEPGALGRTFNVSADGRWLAFSTTDGNTAPDYTNAYPTVLVRDLLAQTNRLVSATTNPLVSANSWSGEAMVSGNGRYVVFTSFASDLVPNDTNRASDVFLRDLQTGVLSLVSTNPPGGGSAYGPSAAPTVSFDGHHVLFFNCTSNLLLRDTVAATNYLLTSGVSNAVMTPDGRYVAFTGILGHYADTLYVWDAQAARYIYTNWAASSPTYLAVSTNGQWLAVAGAGHLLFINRLANTNMLIGSKGVFDQRSGLKFSGDGRFLVYSSTATNVPAATNGFRNVYLFDAQTGSNILVSHRYDAPAAANGDSYYPDISPDGRYVVYESAAANLVPGDSNGFRDVYLYDQQTGGTMLLTAAASGTAPGNWFSEAPRFTGEGDTVVLESFASNLAGNDFNGGGDLFLLTLASTNSASGPTNQPPFYVGQIFYTAGTALDGTARPPTLAWPASPGVSYQVFYKDELTDAEWQPLNGSVTVMGNQGQAVDFAPNPDHRFYRVVAN